MDQVSDQQQQIVRQVSVVPGSIQVAPGVTVQNGLRPLFIGFAERLLPDEQGIPLQQLRSVPAHAALGVPCLCVTVDPKRFVRHVPVVFDLRGLGDPMAHIIVRIMGPAIGQIGGTELLVLNGRRVQELIVQLRERHGKWLRGLGNVQGVTVRLAPGQELWES